MRIRATAAPAHGGRTAETGRVEAFSDGVLATVITLLVLELHPPSEPGAMLTELLVPYQLPYVVSGAVAGLAVVGCGLTMLGVHLDRVEAAMDVYGPGGD